MALKDITLGQYFPGNSLLHRFDPRSKILFTVLFIAAIFLCKGLVAVEQGRVIAAAKSGKVKTASTMVCICLMLLLSNAATLRLVCVWIILLTTIYSGIEYFIKNRDVLANGEM